MSEATRTVGGVVAAVAALLVIVVAVETVAQGADDDATLTVYVSAPLQGPRADAGHDVADGARLALADADGKAGGVAIDLEVLSGCNRRRLGRGCDQHLNARAATEDTTTIAYVQESSTRCLRVDPDHQPGRDPAGLAGQRRSGPATHRRRVMLPRAPGERPPHLRAGDSAAATRARRVGVDGGLQDLLGPGRQRQLRLRRLPSSTGSMRRLRLEVVTGGNPRIPSTSRRKARPCWLDERAGSSTPTRSSMTPERSVRTRRPCASPRPPSIRPAPAAADDFLAGLRGLSITAGMPGRCTPGYEGDVGRARPRSGAPTTRPIAAMSSTPSSTPATASRSWDVLDRRRRRHGPEEAGRLPDRRAGGRRCRSARL